MDIKIKTYIFFILLILFSNICLASKKVWIERYETWEHPVLPVLEKYGIDLLKVKYSMDGKYPVFYGKFKYSPDTRAPDEASFHRVYFELLKANSYHPYSIVDTVDDLRMIISVSVSISKDGKKNRVFEVNYENESAYRKKNKF